MERERNEGGGELGMVDGGEFGVIGVGVSLSASCELTCCWVSLEAMERRPRRRLHRRRQATYRLITLGAHSEPESHRETKSGR